MWLPVQTAKFNGLEFDIQNKGTNERTQNCVSCNAVGGEYKVLSSLIYCSTEEVPS
jgi:hypothetical protein